MYIFIDIDGVLNTKEDWEERLYTLNSRCVEAFCLLLEKIDNPKIVISSTWRNGLARDGRTATHVEELMNILNNVGISYIGRTATSPKGIRSEEIDYYLRRHDEDEYLILDDDKELFILAEKTPYLYLVDPLKGITNNDVKCILRKVRKYRRNKDIKLQV